MKFDDVRKIGKMLDKYLLYKGYNLWYLSEAGIYNNFLKEKRKRGLLDKIKERIMKPYINRINTSRENEITENIIKKAGIFFIPYDISHVNTFLPIIDKLGRNKINVIRVDSPRTNIVKDSLKKYGIRYKNLDNYVNENIKDNINISRKTIRQAFDNIKKDKQLLSRLGNKRREIIEVLDYYSKTRMRFIEIMRLIGLFEEMYRIEKPRIVIVADDVNPVGRIAVLMARKNRIPSLCIQHGQFKGNPVHEVCADKILVNGMEDKKFLLNKGVAQNKIIVTGQARFDKISRINLSKKEARKDLGLSQDKKVIMFSFQKNVRGQNVTEEALRCFLEGIKKIDNENEYEFIITARDDAGKKNIEMLMALKNIKTYIGGDIYKIIKACDAYVTAFSTLATEAVLLKKPVIAININSKEYVDYTNLGVGFRILNEREYIPSLKKILYDKKFMIKFNKSRVKFIRDFAYKLDGKSTERAVKIILKLSSRINN